MNVSMNPLWRELKAHGIKTLGRPGFAEWLEHAAAVVRVEAKREAMNAAHLARDGQHVKLATSQLDAARETLIGEDAA